MIDVAVAAGILAVVVSLALSFIFALSDSAQTSLLRANARRQSTLLQTSLETDLGTALPCGSNRFRSPLIELNDPDGLGPGSFALYVDLDGDGDADLVAYRLNGARLERVILLNTSGCAALPEQLASASWQLMAQPVRVLPGHAAMFTLRKAGSTIEFAGSCRTEITACRMDALQVALALDPPGSGRMELDRAYDLPEAVASL